MSYRQSPLRVGIIGCGWFAQRVQEPAGMDSVGPCDLVRQHPQELRELKDGLIERAARVR